MLGRRVAATHTMSFRSLIGKIAARRRPLAVAGIFVYGFVLSLVIGVAAVRSIGAPFPSVAIDALGAWSVSSLPEWGTEALNPEVTVQATDGSSLARRAVEFPSRVVAVDGGGEKVVINPDRYRSNDTPGRRVLDAVGAAAA